LKAEARKRRVSAGDQDAMLEALGYERGTPAVTERECLAVAFLVALGTGMRKGELLKSRRSARHDHHIGLPAAITKTRKQRDVALTPSVCALLDLLPKDHDLLFGGLDVDRADVLWRAARSKTKVGDLHFHDSRHEAVTQMAKKLPLLALAAQIGHSDLNSLKAYYNATPKEIAGMLEAA
jgi:integrase